MQCLKFSVLFLNNKITVNSQETNIDNKLSNGVHGLAYNHFNILYADKPTSNICFLSLPASLYFSVYSRSFIWVCMCMGCNICKVNTYKKSD